MTRLLLVDDDESVRITLAANLELEGFEIIEADSAENAISCMADAKADLVLSDVRMPGMNGVELAMLLRRDYPQLPVVLMTAFAAEDLIHEAYMGGVFTVLPKPFSVTHAVATLQRASRRPHVIVVDDVASDADSLAGALRAAGLTVHAVYDAASALAAMRTGNFDVAVTDLKMPDVDGVALAERIRALDSSVALIAFSAYSVPEMVRRVSAIGVHACMRKPLDPAKLIEAIALARAKPTPEMTVSA